LAAASSCVTPVTVEIEHQRYGRAAEPLVSDPRRERPGNSLLLGLIMEHGPGERSGKINRSVIHFKLPSTYDAYFVGEP
jgi:hypothetical protein